MSPCIGIPLAPPGDEPPPGSVCCDCLVCQDYIGCYGHCRGDSRETPRPACWRPAENRDGEFNPTSGEAGPKGEIRNPKSEIPNPPVRAVVGSKSPPLHQAGFRRLLSAMAQIGPAGTAALAAHLSTTAAHVRYWYGLASAARLVEAFAGPDGRWLYRLTAAGRVLARNLAQQGELAGPKPILPGMVAGLLILAAGLVVVTSAAGPSPPRGFTRPGGASPVAAGAILMQTDPGPGTRKLPPAPVRSSSLRSTSRPASPAGSASIFDLRSAISELPMMTEADRGPASTSSSMPTHAGGLSAGIAGDAEARRARAVEANPKAETRNSNFEPRSPNSELRSSNFDPRSSKPVIYRMLVTAYCPCGRCCGRWAGVPLPQRRTASGARLEPLLASGGCFAAAPPEIPFGTILRIPGYAGGRPVPVLDRGGDIHGDRLDVFFPTHRQALAWGRRVLDVEVLP